MKLLLQLSLPQNYRTNKGNIQNSTNLLMWEQLFIQKNKLTLIKFETLYNSILFKHIRPLKSNNLTKFIYEVWQKINETDFLFTKVFTFFKHQCYPNVLLKTIQVEDFQGCYQKWKQCLHQCVAAQGNYFEGNNIDV